MKIARYVTIAVIVAALLAIVGGGPTLTTAASTYGTSAFPDSDADSGRFVNITRGASTLGESSSNFEIGVDGSQVSWTLGIFDGDMGATWDPYVSGPDVGVFKLYADPNRNGNTNPGDLIAQWLSTAMPDDDWFTAVINTTLAAQDASGNYGYNLVANWSTTNYTNEQNNFKVRAEGGQVYVLGGSTYGFVGYTPSDPDPVKNPSVTYDGHWQFFADVQDQISTLDLWDGDFDRSGDTDDPESPPFPPFPYASIAVAEGVNPGAPIDDVPNPSFRVSPDIQYTVTAPGGAWSETNDNPSGNQEWELFRLRLVDVGAQDAVVPSLPLGLYDWDINGADGRNTLFLYSDHNLYGELAGLIGDRVWNDTNGDGVQDGGEGGLNGVTVELWRDTDGNGTVDQLVKTTTTSGDGDYEFTDLPPGSYEVHVIPGTGDLPANWFQTYDLDDGTGPFSSPNQTTVPLGPAEENRDADFGYRSPTDQGALGALGDQVWLDTNGNGIVDAGETGINGVTVELYDSNGTKIATDVTHSTPSGDGFYAFGDLPAGTYTVKVYANTLPVGLIPTWDYECPDGQKNGIATFCGVVPTPYEGQVTLAQNETNLDVDFGFQECAGEACSACQGGVTDLTLQYQGASAATVEVRQKDQNGPTIFGPTLLQPNEVFQFSGAKADGTMDTSIAILVNGSVQTSIHTSCSQPIGPGLVSGDFLIISGESRDGGALCPLDVCSPESVSGIVFDNDKVKWTVANTGDLAIVISQITISWPSASGDLIEIKLGGSKIHDGDFSPTSAVINSGWAGNVGDRTIAAGNAETFEFKFATNPASKDGEYRITVEFEAGCSISVSYEPPVHGADFVCSDLSGLSMIWDGAQSVDVTAWKWTVGSAQLVGTASNVVPGQKVTFPDPAYDGSPNDVFWSVFDHTTGNLIGVSDFHMSCSDNDMNGPEDCGKLEGNAKGTTGLNLWLLDGLWNTDGTYLQCTP